MIYIHFIVNPVSGNGRHNINAPMLRHFFPASKYTIKIDYTKYKTHAMELSRRIVAQDPDCVVACGGDGTINEVASALVNTGISLAIIPLGSGNGLASNLNIPASAEQAIDIILNGNSSFIDVGLVNDRYFFSNMGIGIDAMIIQKYEKAGKRRLGSYIRATLSASLEYKPWETIVHFDNLKMVVRPLLLFISNSNEMGYNMSLTPKASLHDGMLDLVVVPQLSFFEKLLLGYYVLRNRTERFKKATHSLITHIELEMPDKIFLDLQADGEYHNLKTNKARVEVIKKGLKVIC